MSCPDYFINIPINSWAVLITSWDDLIYPWAVLISLARVHKIFNPLLNAGWERAGQVRNGGGFHVGCVHENGWSVAEQQDRRFGSGRPFCVSVMIPSPSFSPSPSFPLICAWLCTVHVYTLPWAPPSPSLSPSLPLSLSPSLFPSLPLSLSLSLPLSLSLLH